MITFNTFKMKFLHNKVFYPTL